MNVNLRKDYSNSKTQRAVLESLSADNIRLSIIGFPHQSLPGGAVRNVCDVADGDDEDADELVSYSVSYQILYTDDQDLIYLDVCLAK